MSITLQSGQTAVYVASLKGHLQAVQLLLEKHADITICKKVSFSLCYSACMLDLSTYHDVIEWSITSVCCQSGGSQKSSKSTNQVWSKCQQGPECMMYIIVMEFVCTVTIYIHYICRMEPLPCTWPATMDTVV